MKKICLGIIVISMLEIESCDNCTKSENVYMPLYMNEYFSVYKPDSYFIFLNQDSTKRDSMYITNYDSTVFSPKSPNCLRQVNLSYKLHSQYLTANQQIAITIQTIVGGLYYDFIANSTSNDRTWNMFSKQNVDTFYSPWGPVPLIGPPIARISSYDLWNNPLYNLAEVTPYYHSGQGVVYFAPQKGIVKYVTNDLKDSFTLVKFFTP